MEIFKVQTVEGYPLFPALPISVEEQGVKGGGIYTCRRIWVRSIDPSLRTTAAQYHIASHLILSRVY